ncbi:protein kinase [Nocardia sp. BMG51109]|uniref:protein kinase domain-containing protein n=1 Tax=Nocardia sp. BMG51109 TaxID=1056816 RepID=UPI0004634DE1|nr:protein kinase [Nocardia sp. BMG51109]
MLNNGAMIADRYRLQRLIATGGMGQVWEALDTRLDRRVAVKVLKAEFSADPTFRHRFRTEAKTTAQLNHPGIAGIYDYGETYDPQGGETAYLVMELVQGEPLNAVLNRMNRLSVAQGLDMLEQTGRALEVAHAAGVVHRDVKPGNILVTPTGQVKITDFGIAKAVDASPVTKTGMVMGTAQYIAPEQATGEDATASSDVYSLGVVGYEALSGHRPFSGDGALTVAMKHVRENPPPMPTDLPPNVRELIETTMTKDPAGRYYSGGEFADAVAAVRAGRRPPPPRGLGSPQTGAARVLPPAGPTAMLPRDEYDDATVRYPTQNAGGTAAMSRRAAPVPPDDEGKSRFSTGQKALAGLGIGALALGGIAAWVLLSGDPPESSVTPVKSPTSQVAPPPVPTTTTEPPTTQYEPPQTYTTTPEQPTTTQPPTTTTTPGPPSSTRTQRPSSTAPTTTGRLSRPSLDLPFTEIPGLDGNYGTHGTRGTGGNGIPGTTPDSSSSPDTAPQGLP